VKARIKEFEEIESVVSVWTTADWLEREVYDMFGVRYGQSSEPEAHPATEDWVGYPLRKDYNIRLQDVEWVRKHLASIRDKSTTWVKPGTKIRTTSHPAVSYFIYVDQRDIIRYQ